MVDICPSGKTAVPIVGTQPAHDDSTAPLAILLVDAAAEDADAVAAMLGRPGAGSFEILRAAGRTDGLALLETRRFDACLVEFCLDTGTALDFMDDMDRRGIDVPVIILTHHDDRDADLAAERRGAYDFLVKHEASAAAIERAIRYALARRRLESHLARSALYDDLTGLPNRRQFLLHLERAAERAIRQSVAVCIAFLDLDGFKAVNDRLGHDAGDEVLRRVANRIECCVRRQDVAARLAGDEFAIILEGSRDPAAVEQIIARLKARLSEPMEVADRTIVVGVSVGIAWFPDEAASIFEAFRLADHAMYRAKRGTGTGPRMCRDALRGFGARDQRIGV